MSDDMADPEVEGADAAETPEAAKPVKSTRVLRSGGAVPGKAPGARPAGAPRPGQPPPAKASKTKGILMLSIILAILGLSGAIVVKLIPRLFPHSSKELNAEKEIDLCFDKARDARKEVELIENNVTVKSQDLGAADAIGLQKGLQALEECAETLVDIRSRLREEQQRKAAKGKDKEAAAISESADWDKLTACELQVKLWILDASSLIEFAKNAPEYGGLYIPMRRTQAAMRKAQKELFEYRDGIDGIATRNDAAEKAKARARVKELKDAFAAYRDRLNQLDTFVKEGLVRPELSPKEVKELEELHDDASKAQMSFKEAGRVLQLIPE